jgi:hypothetical protein
MGFIEKSFNAVAATLGLVSRIEQTSKDILHQEAARRKMLDATSTYQSVKIITRSDTQERVRIVQWDQNYGVIVDFHDPKCGWSPEAILGGGIIYESPVAAELVAHTSLAWLKENPVDTGCNSRR